MAVFLPGIYELYWPSAQLILTFGRVSGGRGMILGMRAVLSHRGIPLGPSSISRVFSRTAGPSMGTPMTCWTHLERTSPGQGWMRTMEVGGADLWPFRRSREEKEHPSLHQEL